MQNNKRMLSLERRKTKKSLARVKVTVRLITNISSVISMEDFQIPPQNPNR